MLAIISPLGLPLSFFRLEDSFLPHISEFKPWPIVQLKRRALNLRSIFSTNSPPTIYFTFHRRVCYGFIPSLVLLPPSRMTSVKKVTPIPPAKIQTSIIPTAFSNPIGSPLKKCFSSKNVYWCFPLSEWHPTPMILIISLEFTGRVYTYWHIVTINFGSI